MEVKLFTKSAFKIAMRCPAQLYYYRDPKSYANQNNGDEFLQALAQGGFQVGELANLYCEVVKRYFWHPEMKGSNSIKFVLPAVLNASELLQKRYSKPIYGSDIPSENIPKDKPVSWITKDVEGKVQNPYKLLPPISSYFPEEARDCVDAACEGDDGDEKTVANGGAALWAYGMMQFTDDANHAALANALLRYCELDTLAMVFIWEYFNDECNKEV